MRTSFDKLLDILIDFGCDNLPYSEGTHPDCPEKQAYLKAEEQLTIQHGWTKAEFDAEMARSEAEDAELYANDPTMGSPCDPW